MIHDNIFNNYVLNVNFKDLFEITDNNKKSKTDIQG